MDLPSLEFNLLFITFSSTSQTATNLTPGTWSAFWTFPHPIPLIPIAPILIWLLALLLTVEYPDRVGMNILPAPKKTDFFKNSFLFILY